MLRRLAALTSALVALTPVAAAAQAPDSVDVPTAEGYPVHVAFSEAAGGVNPALATAYVGFLDSLPHGPELARLTIEVGSVDQVAGLCGGLEQQGILACYSARHQRMTVPNVGIDAVTTDGVYSLRYVLAHEYGHHIARNRRNPGFHGGSIDWGPKLWASSELVCERAARKQLFPGSERGHYHANPGENWAEAYARLAFPDQPWSFSPLLTPDGVTLDAARRDVVAPWTGNRTAVFHMPARRHTERFSVPLTLDGTVRALIRGPRRSEVGVRVSLAGRALGSSHHKGRTDTFARARTCRSAPSQALTVTAIRKGGRRGPVTLAVSYPG